jgi:hypothetical protein
MRSISGTGHLGTQRILKGPAGPRFVDKCLYCYTKVYSLKLRSNRKDTVEVISYLCLLQVDGKFIDLAVGASTVWALGSNREFYYRYSETVIIKIQKEKNQK